MNRTRLEELRSQIGSNALFSPALITELLDEIDRLQILLAKESEIIMLLYWLKASEEERASILKIAKEG